MFNIENNSIVICSNNIKKDILLNENELKNIKFFTIKEFINNYYGTYKKDAIYYVMSKYGFNFDVTKEYLDNVFYDYEAIKDFYYDLECNDLLDINKLFRSEIKDKKIYVIGYYNFDKYIIDLLKSLNATFIEFNNNYTHDVFEFNHLDDEIVFVINDIINNHKDNLNDVYLVNIDDNYCSSIKRLFKLFNLNINLKEQNSIYSIKEVQDFLKNLKTNLEIDLNLIENIEIKNKIIDLINKYNIVDIDKYNVQIIESEMKNIYLDHKVYEQAVNVIGINDIYLKDKYYYIMNFNQGSVPKIFHDDKFIKDVYREKIGLNTSLDNLNNYKKMVVDKLNNYENIIITYKLKDNYKNYIKSPLLDELGLDVKSDVKKDYNHSNSYNKIEFAKMLDNYTNFNVLNKDVYDLYATYGDINYMKYDNSFKNVSFSLLKKYINRPINISYSSMDSFFKCKFRYYINNLLCLGDFEDTIQTFIGNLFHDSLSKMYNKNFDLRKEYNNYLKDKKLTNKELFYVNKLYPELEKIIETIRIHDRHSLFNDALTEHNVFIEKDKNLDINVKGYIDKVKILKEGSNTYVSIIDYKTGNTELSLNNINYGLNMQLPMYLYLIKKDMNNVNVVGFYLQKILDSKTINSKDYKKDEFDSLKLIGYTINEEDLIEKFDDTYTKSDVIKSMKITKNGFYKYAKLVSEEEINKIIDIVDDHINEVVNSIKEGDFKINPKRINDKLLGCQYCGFKDLCFKREEDIVDLKEMKKEEILNS